MTSVNKIKWMKSSTCADAYCVVASPDVKEVIEGCADALCVVAAMSPDGATVLLGDSKNLGDIIIAMDSWQWMRMMNYFKALPDNHVFPDPYEFVVGNESLTFTRDEMIAFVAGVKLGDFDVEKLLVGS